MSASASLDTSSVSVRPGSEAEVPLQVRNSGTTVEEYRFEVAGPCAAWAVVEPASLSLYPGTASTAVLRLRPPRSAGTAAGELPFGVRVVPANHPEGTVVPEGTVTVLPFTEVTAELVPPGTHGAWRGRQRVAVDNRGNTPVTVRLADQAVGERIRLAFTPAELSIPPGQAAFGKLAVRPAKRLWRGTPVTHTYQVAVVPEAEEPQAPVVLDGTYQQEAILPRWLPRAVVLALLSAAVLVGLWYALLRPVVTSAAREAITPEAVRSAVAATDLPEGGGGPEQPGGGSDGGVSGGGAQPGPSASGAGGPGSPGGPGSSGGQPTSVPLEVRDAVGGDSQTGSGYEVPEGRTFELTDLVVQNPQGDAGTLVISTGDQTLLRLSLQNFRDLDYHFVTPIVVPSGGEVTMTVTCRQVGRPVNAPAPSQCAESLLLGGTLRPEAGAAG